MTYEEATEHLKKLRSFHNGSYGAAVKMAIAAIDKQIQQKPNSGVDRTWGKPLKEAICPVCDYVLGHWEFIGDAKKITYCEHCGQAITWEGWEWTD